jgi:hypothetical protein
MNLADDPLRQLPPTQTEGIPGFPSKTPVAQMHFAWEFPLSEGDRSINMAGQLMITQANLGASRKKMGKLLWTITLTDNRQQGNLPP